MAQLLSSVLWDGALEVANDFCRPDAGTYATYVFVLLAYLVWLGVLSRRTRRLGVWRMLTVPGLFEVTGLLLIVLRPSGDIMPMAAWLVGLVAFVPLGLVTGPRLLAVDRTSVTRAGSPVSLVRNPLVFGAQYGIAVALFRHPEAHASLTVAGHAVSGTSVGYFMGWTIAFRRRFRAGRDAALSTLEAGRPATMVRKS
jgi:hypothetical protein